MGPPGSAHHRTRSGQVRGARASRTPLGLVGSRLPDRDGTALSACWTQAVGLAGSWALRPPRFLPRGLARAEATTSSQSPPAPFGFSRLFRAAPAQLPDFTMC